MYDINNCFKLPGPLQTSILDSEMIIQSGNTKVETYADGTVVVNGRRCTCNDNEFKGGSSLTACRCFTWLIPLLVLILSWSFDYMYTFRLEQIVIILYIYLCVFKYFG